jgi:hypothetical protein
VVTELAEHARFRERGEKAGWNEGRPLSFEGEYYRHTLMTAMFRPAPNPYGPPRNSSAATATWSTG